MWKPYLNNNGCFEFMSVVGLSSAAWRLVAGNLVARGFKTVDFQAYSLFYFHTVGVNYLRLLWLVMKAKILDYLMIGCCVSVVGLSSATPGLNGSVLPGF